jgi:transcriptional regulator with GAF, ATPase, and Fis domain/serine/threonine protein kinase
MRYLVERHLGTGGIGSSWLVHDTLTNSPVALKLLHHRSADALAALRREFTLLRGLLHPNLARVHDFGFTTVENHPSPFYTSDFVDGVSLTAFAGAQPFSRCFDATVLALHALAHLHRVGIRHGDVTPSNILVRADGTATLIDLSCAVPLGAPASDSISGTPGYLAPEVIEGRRADARADIFSVGVLLNRLADASCSSAPSHVLHVAAQCCLPDPSSRPPSVHHVLDQLGMPAHQPHAIYVPPARLIGREEPWAAIKHELDALIARQPATRRICLSGKEGVGRTRLLQELKWEAQLHCPVVEGSARRPHPVHDMLCRALSSDVAPDFRSLLETCEQLNHLPSPIVFVFDDAHLLEEAARQALLAVARQLDPSGPVLLAWSTLLADDPPEPALFIELAPLSEASLRTWPEVPARLAARLSSWTGGFPASVVALLSQVSANASDLRDLPRSPTDVWEARRSRRVRELSASLGAALAVLSVMDDGLPEDAIQALSIEVALLSELMALGFAKRDAQGWRLARAVEARDIQQALGVEVVRAAHGAVASWLRALPSDSPRVTARLVEHLALSGSVDRAVDLLRRGLRDAFRDPVAWRHAALSVIEASPGPDGLLLCVEVLTKAGRPDRALQVLDERLWGATDPWIQLARAAARLARGEAEQALEALSGHEYVGDEVWMARAAIVRSRAYIHRGDATLAMSTAREACKDGLPTELRAELCDAVGVAASYLGETKEAWRSLREAALLHERTGRVDALVRTLSYQAFHAYRRGETGAAERAYRDSRDRIDRHGFTDMLANAELNVGAACHQGGRWGEALTCYDQGLRVASALGQTSHEVQARFNLAKLYVDIGAESLAQTMIERGRVLAGQAGQRFFEVAFGALLADVALLGGRFDQAKDLFRQAAEAFESAGARREATEVRLQVIEAMVGMGAIGEASRELDDFRLAEGLEAPDLQASMALTRARVRLAEGKASDAVAALEEAGELARQADQPAVRADIHRLFAQVWERQRSFALSKKEADLARQFDERLAASLPGPLQESFWTHPKRRAARAVDSRHGVPALADKVRRLLDINAKLNSSLRTKDVLNRTMEAAVELVGAERGFLILLETPDQLDGPVSVPIARNLDREQVGKRHLKFSRSIAEQCMVSGEPIVTTDAQVDGRFSGHGSVHAMRLKSVVCVPIHSPSGMLGALYLDNRFQRGSFDEQDLELLSAFGNQAAIALTNARLHDELRRRTQQLEQERSRVQALMASQAQEIDRLTDEVRTTRQVLEHRYDYSNIVGRSRGMQQVFAMLDRVIDSDVPVLILGESGTGKELIARALHVHGKRRDKPFVAINCAAVPPTLLESELFGHVRGAYTGADRDHDGLLVSARGGSVLLDEIGDMPLGMQAKLLRVLQEGEVRPLGATRSTKVSFRLACATNRNLIEDVGAGRFRQDLFYRINVVPITLPPLRERRDDIVELAHHFLERHAQKLGKPVPRLDREALQALIRHSWPGNVRELENVLLQAVLLCEANRVRAVDVQGTSRPVAPLKRIRSRRDYQTEEEERIRSALVASRWNVSQVARELGVSRPTLYRKMRQYGIHEG